MNILLFSVLSVCCISSVICFRFMLGPGRWLVLNARHCEDPKQYDVNVTINRKKLNRTHDRFQMIAESDKDFEETFSYGIKIDVYQQVDGGFKFYERLSDRCLCKFIKRHAKENMERALSLAGVNPPDCPITGNRLEIPNFVMDYRELPKIGVYGTFETRVYGILRKKIIACYKLLLNFDEISDDYDDD